MDIGSNKPSAADMSETPHHLVGVRDPTLGQDCSSGEFVRLAEPAIRDILTRGKVA
jgi:tRNA A37 N6-isopentenylltransferase MiaA